MRLPLLVTTPLFLALIGPLPATAHQRPIKLTVHAGRVKPGNEKQTCFPVEFPLDREVDVDHVQIFVHGGSHHVHLYRPTSGPVEYPNPDKTYSPAARHNPPRECKFAIDFSHWELVAATQNADLNLELHPGVGIHFLPHQPLLIQTHFVNTGFGGAGLKVKGSAHAKMLLYPMQASTVTAHGGALFGQDRTVHVPPGRTDGQPSTCALTGPASDNHPMSVMALTGHYHFRGIKFEVWRMHVDGTRGELVYENEGYSDPKFQQYAPGELVLQAGEGLAWACTWQNDSDMTFDFGPDTTMNEHCNLFGFYYPTDQPLEAIDCVHNVDGSEQRILAQ